MQRTKLKVKMSAGNILSDSTQAFLYAREASGCETTSLDPYAQTWENLHNCVLAVLRTKDVDMVKQGTK